MRKRDALDKLEFDALLDLLGEIFAPLGYDPAPIERAAIRDYLRRAFVPGYDPMNPNVDALDGDDFRDLLDEFGTWYWKQDREGMSQVRRQIKAFVRLHRRELAADSRG